MAVLAALAVALWARERPPALRTGPVGLFTTLPVLWSEESDIGAMLRSSDVPHWAKEKLAAAGPVTALDTLDAPGPIKPLGSLTRLVIAQPRPLSPGENVALDAWVRGGGRVLLLADPALTEESHFAIGDPRRPQTVVLLSPILRRWGLDLRFDEAQPFGTRTVQIGSVAVPVNLPGQFAPIGKANCTVGGGGVLAQCRIGKGRVTALADAAVMERDDDDGARARALAALLNRAFED